VAGAWTHRGADVDVVWRDQADVDEAGRFQLDGMFGERSLQVIGLPDGWHVQQIVHDGRQAPTLNVSSDAPAVTIVVAAR
jgi:hypothetical protein